MALFFSSYRLSLFMSLSIFSWFLLFTCVCLLFLFWLSRFPCICLLSLCWLSLFIYFCLLSASWWSLFTYLLLLYSCWWSLFIFVGQVFSSWLLYLQYSGCCTFQAWGSQYDIAANMLDCNIIVNSNSYHIITFTVRLILLGKVWTTSPSTPAVSQIMPQLFFYNDGYWH